jgi:hypothetical protein
MPNEFIQFDERSEVEKLVYPLPSGFLPLRVLFFLRTRIAFHDRLVKARFVVSDALAG